MEPQNERAFMMHTMLEWFSFSLTRLRSQPSPFPGKINRHMTYFTHTHTHTRPPCSQAHSRKVSPTIRRIRYLSIPLHVSHKAKQYWQQWLQASKKGTNSLVQLSTGWVFLLGKCTLQEQPVKGQFWEHSSDSKVSLPGARSLLREGQHCSKCSALSSFLIGKALHDSSNTAIPLPLKGEYLLSCFNATCSQLLTLES